MNIYVVSGFLIAILIFVSGLFLASPNLLLFVDYPSMFIVVGGTFAASAITFQLNRIKVLIFIFVSRMLKGVKFKPEASVHELIVIADKYRKGVPLTTLIEESKDFFIIESLELIKDGMLSDEDIIEVLELRNQKLATMNNMDAGKMKTLGKFPPAFGMIGTTIGMIVLLANLGGEDAMKMIGPAMGVCLITTLYGAVIANLVFIPISENLIESTKDVFHKNEIIIEGIRLICSKTNPIVVSERLNSYLRPGSRLDWKEIITSGGESARKVKVA